MLRILEKLLCICITIKEISINQSFLQLSYEGTLISLRLTVIKRFQSIEDAANISKEVDQPIEDVAS